MKLFLKRIFPFREHKSDMKDFWVKKSYKIEGTAQFTEEDGQVFFVLNDDFKTIKGPDLKLFLSKSSMEELNGKNAMNNATLINELYSHKGAQKYILPKGVKLEDYQSLIIHCERYSVLWGGFNLNKIES